MEELLTSLRGKQGVLTLCRSLSLATVTIEKDVSSARAERAALAGLNERAAERQVRCKRSEYHGERERADDREMK